MRPIKNPGITLARRYKKVGGTKKQYLEITTASIRKTAKEEGWRDSELTMSLMERQRLADKVWRG